MQLRHNASFVAITGTKGVGKSTFFFRYILGHKAKYKFLFDHQGEAPYVLGEPATVESMEDMVTRIKAGETEFNYNPHNDYPGELPTAFDDFCDFVFEFASNINEHILFATDELQNLDRTSILSPPFGRIVETGRRRGIDAVAICQSLNTLHNRVRNQFTEVVAFKSVGSRALEYLEAIDFDTDEILRLQKFHYVSQDLFSGEFQRGKVFPLTGSTFSAQAENETQSQVESGQSISDQPEPNEIAGEKK